MRQDMHKVVVERERSNAVYGYSDFRSARKNDKSEEAPLHEGIRRPYGYERKRLNENLGPLKKFLRSRVGQPWDKIYAEVSKNLRASNAVQQHVRDHLEDFVRFNVIVKDGYFQAPRFRGQLGWTVRLDQGDLYVDSHGILRMIKHSKPKVKKDRAYSTYVITSITYKTSGSKHVSRHMITYYLHLQKKHLPATGESLEETIEALSYDAALNYFKERYKVNPVHFERSTYSNCMCADCQEVRRAHYQRLKLIAAESALPSSS